MMKEDFLEKLDPELVRAIERFLKTHKISDSVFESAIYRLYGQSTSALTNSTVNRILLRFELKIACDLVTASQSDDYGAVTFSTYKLFNRMLRHLYKASNYKSVFDLNISNLSHLSKARLSAERIVDILTEFAAPEAGIEPGVAAKIRDGELVESESDSANVVKFLQPQTYKKRGDDVVIVTFPVGNTYKVTALLGRLDGNDIIKEKETRENVAKYLGKKLSSGAKEPGGEKENLAEGSGDSSSQ